MSTTELLVGQMAGPSSDANDPLLLNANAGSFIDFDHEVSKTMYPDPPQGPPDHYVAMGADMFAMHDYSLPDFNAALNATASMPDMVDSDTISSTLLSPDSQPKEHAKKVNERKYKSRKTTKQKASVDSSAEKPDKSPPKTRRQPKREAAAKTVKTKEPTPRPSRRERSLERNRVAASKCRKRKKAWTEKLEEKKSGLEAMHNELQARYFSLLQESSQLKNHLISHAGCHDPNIDVWINNEASKYVRRLSGEAPQRPASMRSLPSLDNSLWNSSTNSQYTMGSENTPTPEDGEDSNSEVLVDDHDFDNELDDKLF
ncbi:uncharacterized protein UV8b_07017 [Ustilaginoidea virens]|uniref:BZIP domain-containing protein n=1 Tax=Ustilaginoidea virens TaxID=1159556 RepID=A0A063C8N0_USTVR|nr:uncharacterized protein UV8b_07017 [Ustilaginoidea virens]QUC22776.1 hypothetical protein UV8b_07017 [Ustilaginoidea virens]GAO15410.1 hypothetical protein UVI_02010720 [Ustilaginoidea virens]